MNRKFKIEIFPNTINVWICLYASNTFVQQGRIKLIKSDSKDIYNVRKDFYFK